MLAAGTLLGPYKILAPLGAGGMGEVYRAHDPRLGRDVAIKVLPSHLATTAEARARFEREARTISQLNHPHICTLYDIGHEDGADYLVMELLEGETLAHRLEKGPLPVDDVLSLGRQLAGALDRAHRAGVVHRDLKPGNVMLTKAGAKLMDFGLARTHATSAVAGSMTQSPTLTRPLTAEGAIVGTFQYMAPEQLEGKEADARSDLWALGCVLYEMGTGQRAFTGESPASLIAAIMERQPRSMTDLRPMTPPALGRVVQRCLEKDPDARVQNASDLAFDLESVANLPHLVPGAATVRAPATGVSNRVAWTLAGVAILVGLAFAASHLLWRPAATAQPAFQRLTFRRGTVDNARFTPDGQTVVFDARWDGDSSEIFTLRPGNPESRALGIRNTRLLGVSSRGELAIQLRPAYLAGTYAGTLARIPLEGGVPREVRERVFEADWNPDGVQLAIAPSDSVSWSLQMPPGRTIMRSLDPLSLMRPSPDGGGVAFWRRGMGGLGGELRLAWAGRPDRGLSPIGVVCTGLAWHPRTRELWYTETDTAGSTQLRAVSAGGRRRSLLTLAGNATLHDIRADGTILLSIKISRRAIQTLAPGGTAERDLSWLDSSWPNDLSPDGRLLVIQESGVAGGRVGWVGVRPTDGAPAKRLGEGRGPALSPDGRWVVAWLPGERPRLRVVPVGPGEARDVATGDFVPTSGAWYFADGRRLLVSGRRGEELDRFFTVPIEGGTPSAVTPPGWIFWSGERCLSPDGRWITCANADDVNHIFPVAGGPPRVVPGVEPGEVVLGWTDDSRGLYVFRRGEVPARIHRLDAATGRRQLWKALGPDDRAGVSLIDYALITPDGRSYAYTFERSQTDLYLVKGLR